MSFTSWLDGRIAAALASLNLQTIIDRAADRIVADIGAQLTISTHILRDDVAAVSEHVSLDTIAVADAISENITVNTKDISDAVIAAIRAFLPPFLRGLEKGKS